MKPLLPALILFAFQAKTQLNFKNDNLYKTLYASELCELLRRDPNVQLIDVRSPGEYSDTSRYASLNLGHLKNAININVDTLVKNIDLIKPYHDKTIVFYCSHSQRSRNASKFLYESGYKNFYNLNGGMTTLNQLSEIDFPCKENLLMSGTAYKNLSIEKAADLIRMNKDLVIVDARPAPEFNSVDSIESNNIGRLKNAINVHFENEATDITHLERYKDRPILVYAASGDGNGARLAKKLRENGFKTVYHLPGGIQAFNAREENRRFFDSPTSYTIVDHLGALRLLKTKTDLVVIDTRPDAEFSNSMPQNRSWKNLGHIKNAIRYDLNKPDDHLLPKSKEVHLMVYGGRESYRLAESLKEKGYRNVYVLNSFYDFVWAGFNVEACKDNKLFLVDHAGLY
jgi:rhodanese-related sulfurtransferase